MNSIGRADVGLRKGRNPQRLLGFWLELVNGAGATYMEKVWMGVMGRGGETLVPGARGIQG